MAIAYDATAHGNTGGATSLTFAHTTGSGIDRILWVGFRVGSSTDLASDVTYNGVAMTQAIKRQDTAGSQYVYLYYLIAPATGANNVVISLSSSASIIGISASYSGANQFVQPDATGSQVAQPGTTITASATVVASGCWVISFIGNDGALAMTGSTGVGAVRDNGSFVSNVTSLGDSNGSVSAGSYGMTWTSSSQSLAEVIASFAPPSSGGGILLFM